MHGMRIVSLYFSLQLYILLSMGSLKQEKKEFEVNESLPGEFLAAMEALTSGSKASSKNMPDRICCVRTSVAEWQA